MLGHRLFNPQYTLPRSLQLHDLPVKAQKIDPLPRFSLTESDMM